MIKKFYNVFADRVSFVTIAVFFCALIALLCRYSDPEYGEAMYLLTQIPESYLVDISWLYLFFISTYALITSFISTIFHYLVDYFFNKILNSLEFSTVESPEDSGDK